MPRINVAQENKETPEVAAAFFKSGNAAKTANAIPARWVYALPGWRGIIFLPVWTTGLFNVRSFVVSSMISFLSLRGFGKSLGCFITIMSYCLLFSGKHAGKYKCSAVYYVMHCSEILHIVLKTTYNIN